MADESKAAPFANDGSFLERFLKLQQAQKVQEAQAPAQPTESVGAAAPSRTSLGQERSGSVPPVSRQEAASTSEQGFGDEDFVEAPRFRGARSGYVYKKDSLGLGYYRDVPLVDRLAAAKEAAKQKPVVLKVNNPLLKSLGKRGADIPSVVPGGKKSKPGGCMQGCFSAPKA